MMFASTTGPCRMMRYLPCCIDREGAAVVLRRSAFVAARFGAGHSKECNTAGWTIIELLRPLTSEAAHPNAAGANHKCRAKEPSYSSRSDLAAEFPDRHPMCLHGRKPCRVGVRHAEKCDSRRFCRIGVLFRGMTDKEQGCPHPTSG